MERQLDLTHLLNEDCHNTINDDVNIIFYTSDTAWDYSFNLDDSGLSLVIKQE